MNAWPCGMLHEFSVCGTVLWTADLSHPWFPPCFVTSKKCRCQFPMRSVGGSMTSIENYGWSPPIQNYTATHIPSQAGHLFWPWNPQAKDFTKCLSLQCQHTPDPMAKVEWSQRSQYYPVSGLWCMRWQGEEIQLHDGNTESSLCRLIRLKGKTISISLLSAPYTHSAL